MITVRRKRYANMVSEPVCDCLERILVVSKRAGSGRQRDCKMKSRPNCALSTGVLRRVMSVSRMCGKALVGNWVASVAR